jgi:hypothetical protein
VVPPVPQCNGEGSLRCIHTVVEVSTEDSNVEWGVQAMQCVVLYRSATDGEVSLRSEQELHTHRCLGVHRGLKCGVERGGHAVVPPVPQGGRR